MGDNDPHQSVFENRSKMPFDEYVFHLRAVRLEALCKLQQDNLQNQQDKFKPEVESTGALPLVLAEGSVHLWKKKKKRKTSSLLGNGENIQATVTQNQTDIGYFYSTIFLLAQDTCVKTGTTTMDLLSSTEMHDPGLNKC